jgi:hypothetical protein
MIWKTSHKSFGNVQKGAESRTQNRLVRDSCSEDLSRQSGNVGHSALTPINARAFGPLISTFGGKHLRGYAILLSFPRESTTESKLFKRVLLQLLVLTSFPVRSFVTIAFSDVCMPFKGPPTAALTDVRLVATTFVSFAFCVWKARPFQAEICAAACKKKLRIQTGCKSTKNCIYTTAPIDMVWSPFR